MIGSIIKRDDKKFIIYDTWGERDEYYCIVDFETQTKFELVEKIFIKENEIEDIRVEWLFIAAKKRDLKVLEQYLK